jgi:hypothetical protein
MKVLSMTKTSGKLHHHAPGELKADDAGLLL